LAEDGRNVSAVTGVSSVADGRGGGNVKRFRRGLPLLPSSSSDKNEIGSSFGRLRRRNQYTMAAVAIALGTMMPTEIPAIAPEDNRLDEAVDCDGFVIWLGIDETLDAEVGSTTVEVPRGAVEVLVLNDVVG